MIEASEDALKKFTSPHGVWAPVKRVYYYDTPYSVPSWGMKRVFYSNPDRDGVFNDANILGVGADPILSHAWGKNGPAGIGAQDSYLARWYGYFYAESSGSYTFYVSFDDAARMYMDSSGTPESASSEISLTPVDPDEVDENWSAASIRTNITTYSGTKSLSAGNWYAMKVEFGMFGAGGRGDIVVRYSEPGSSDRKIIGAGVCNYPVLEDWSGPGDASFIGTSTPRSFLNLPKVAAIRGDRGLAKVGSYVIKVPLEDNAYMPGSAPGTYKYFDSDVVLRQGRLVDIWAGYQTRCTNYNVGGDSCNLGLPDEADGGYFNSALCRHVNQHCAFNEPLSTDYVKRMRGRITNMEVTRDKDRSYLEITVQDNLYYLASQFNKNYPDVVSYAAYDYAGLYTSPYNPDGEGMPVAWDAFLLSEAVQDACVKAGVDPTYLYGTMKRLQSDFSYDDGGPLLQGQNVRLTQPLRYGRAHQAGSIDDVATDQPYLWAQGFGEPLIDIVASLADNYGYFFMADPNGNIVFRTRDNPEFKTAEDPAWSSSWTTVIDGDALGGAYLFANGSSSHATLGPVAAGRLEVFMALDPQEQSNAWSMRFNECVDTPGYSDGNYPPEQVSQPVIQNNAPVFGVQEIESPVYSEWVKLYRGVECWVVTNPQSSVTVTSLELHLGDGHDNSEDRVYWKIDIEAAGIGSFDSNQTDNYTRGDPKWSGGSTKVVDGFDLRDLGDVFDGNKHVVNIPLDSSYSMSSRTVWKFITRPFDEATGQEMTLAWQVGQVNQGNQIPHAGGKVCFVGAMVHASASPPGGDALYTDRFYFWNPFSGVRNFDWNYNEASPAWENWTNAWGQPLFHPDIIFANDSATPASWFNIQVRASNNSTILSDNKYPNNVPGRTAAEGIRFSGEGFDLNLGKNPCIFPVFLSDYEDRIGGTYVRAAETYYVHIYGTQAKIEAVGIFDDGIFSSKMKFNTATNIYNLDVDQSSAEIRNDVIVVGRLKGPLTDQNTDQVVNPNNPTLDYVYSRALDIHSVEDHLADNSLGLKSSFLIYEPSVGNAEHADWVARAVLDRHRRLLSEVSMNALAVPYLDIEDAVNIVDPTMRSTVPDSMYWIEGMNETIESKKYSQTLSLTPLPPWPSFVPKPPADVTNYQNVDGEPQLVIDIRMTDEQDTTRWTATGGNAYDCYESEGSSLTYNVAKKNKLKLTFNLIVNGFVNVNVRSRASNKVLTYLLGTGTFWGTSIVREALTAGRYKFLWDGEDHFGITRDRDDVESAIVMSPDSDGYFPGLYGRDGEYYIEIQVDSSLRSHHEDDNAQRIYRSLDLASQTSGGVILNDATLGQVIPGTQYHRQVWELAIGTVAAVEISTSPSVGGHQDMAPGSGNQLLLFTTEDNPNADDPESQGLHVQLDPDSSLTGSELQAMENRKVRYKTTIDECVFLICPSEDQFYQDNGDRAGTNANYRETFAEVFPGGWSAGYEAYRFFRNGWLATQQGLPGKEHFIGRYSSWDDQLTYNTLHILRNLPIVGVPQIERDTTDEPFAELKNSKITLNPSGNQIRHKYNTLPPGMDEDLHTKIMETRSLFSTPEGTGTEGNGLIGYICRNIVYVSKWYNIVYFIYDKSGRALNVVSPATYDQRVGIGKPNTGVYEGKILIRAHWVPVGAKDSDVHDGSWRVDEAWLNDTDNSLPAWQRIDIPSWNPTEPYGQSTDNHVLTCYCSDATPSYVIRQFGSAVGDSLSSGNFNSQYANYMFYAWPIHHFWDTGSSSGSGKLSWTSDPRSDGNADFTSSLVVNSWESGPTSLG
jgi:hypothetical protein